MNTDQDRSGQDRSKDFTVGCTVWGLMGIEVLGWFEERAHVRRKSTPYMGHPGFGLSLSISTNS